MAWSCRPDCRDYTGYKPCRFGGDCTGCREYRPVTENLLIIKLGARGDTLRTTPLLRALRRAHPAARLTWVTAPESLPLLAHNPFLDRVHALDARALAALLPQRFDRLYSFDKDPEAIGLATALAAEHKYGFGMTPSGSLTVFNPAAEYALRLGLDDELKFRGNRQTYPQIIFAMAELPYAGEEYVFALTDAERSAGRARLRELFPDGKPPVGLNTGVGRVFATKAWTAAGHAALARELLARGERVLLLGGADEDERNRALQAELGGAVAYAGGGNDVRQFAALIAGCRLVVTGDTLGLHLAVALRVPVVALIGPTSAVELDLYGRGEQVVVAKECAPCYLPRCPRPDNCMAELAPARVLAAALRQLKNGPGA